MLFSNKSAYSLVALSDHHAAPAAGTVEGVSFQPSDVPVGPVSFKLGSGVLIPGLDEALTGMQQGGKRRILVPPELGYVSSSTGAAEPQPPTFATKRQLANHSREPLLFEVQMLKIRHDN